MRLIRKSCPALVLIYSLGTVVNSIAPRGRPQLFQPKRAASIQHDFMQQVFSGHLFFKKNAYFPV